jgi:hypothetical protein
MGCGCRTDWLCPTHFAEKEELTKKQKSQQHGNSMVRYMTLREAFAMHALQGMSAHSYSGNPKADAKYAVQLSDALLEELGKVS